MHALAQLCISSKYFHYPERLRHQWHAAAVEVSQDDDEDECLPAIKRKTIDTGKLAQKKPRCSHCKIPAFGQPKPKRQHTSLSSSSSVGTACVGITAQKYKSSDDIKMAAACAMFNARHYVCDAQSVIKATLAGHYTEICNHALTCWFFESQAAARRQANKAGKRLRRPADVSAAKATVVGQRATSAGSVLGVTHAPRKAANFRFTIEPARNVQISWTHRHSQTLLDHTSGHLPKPTPKLTFYCLPKSGLHWVDKNQK